MQMRRCANERENVQPDHCLRHHKILQQISNKAILNVYRPDANKIVV